MLVLHFKLNIVNYSSKAHNLVKSVYLGSKGKGRIRQDVKPIDNHLKSVFSEFFENKRPQNDAMDEKAV